MKCNANGTFEINGKTGDEITLPDCNPIIAKANAKSTNPSGQPYIPLSDFPTTDPDPTDPPVSLPITAAFQGIADFTPIKITEIKYFM